MVPWQCPGPVLTVGPAKRADGPRWATLGGLFGQGLLASAGGRNQKHGPRLRGWGQRGKAGPCSITGTTPESRKAGRRPGKGPLARRRLSGQAAPRLRIILGSA